MSDPRKKIITNRAEYEKRAKAYSDSLDLHNYWFSGKGPFEDKTYTGDNKGFVRHSSLQKMLDNLARESGTSQNAFDTAEVMTKRALQPFPNVKNNKPLGWYYVIAPTDYYYTTSESIEKHNALFAPAFKKPTVEPQLGAEKANVPVKSIAPEKHSPVYQRSLPKQIDKIAMNASGTNVYVTINGKTESMSKSAFGLWRKHNEGLYNAYMQNKR